MSAGIILELDPTTGISDSSVAHLPARQSTTMIDSRKFPDLTRAFAPPRWPSACGKVPRGLVFVHAGCLADTPICPACLAVTEPRDA